MNTLVKPLFDTAFEQDVSTLHSMGPFEGVMLYGQDRYDEMLRVLLPFAQGGHAHCQFYLGLLYENGFGVTQNTHTAIDLFERGDKGEVPEASLNLGIVYLEGKHVEKNIALAKRWFERSVELQALYGKLYLGKLHMYDTGDEYKPELAKTLLLEAGEDGCASAFFYLGVGYDDEQLLGKTDYSLAAQYYQQAIDENNDMNAQYRLGVMYEQGLGVTIDKEKANSLLKSAADQGHQEAIHLLKKINAKPSLFKKLTGLFR